MGNFLVVRGLQKNFASFRAIDDISFEVEEGRLLVLLGPSGCGKTTTLRCIGGLERPTSGQIVIDGKDITNIKENIFVPPEARGMGMVAQSYAIWPHMNVFENVAFPLRMRKQRDVNIAERVAWALDVVQLGGMSNRGATDLSGGQQQRVALARAIVAKPKVLLFDEPLSNLDAKLREQMRYLIKDIQRETGITAVYVTHDQAEAMGLGDELIVMNRGRIEQRGDAHSMYLRPKNRFVAEFIGIANLLEATVLEPAPGSSGVLRLTLSNGDEPAVFTAMRGDDELGKEATILIRPESIEIEARKPERVENVIGGKIRSVQYLGDRTEFVVQTVAREIRVTKIGRPSFTEGTEVYLTFDTENALAISPAGNSEAGKDHRQ